jgi:hypothetical protein
MIGCKRTSVAVATNHVTNHVGGELHVSSETKTKTKITVKHPLTSLQSQMVRTTIVVRASDALPLAASVDDEQVRHHSIDILHCH